MPLPSPGAWAPVLLEGQGNEEGAMGLSFTTGRSVGLSHHLSEEGSTFINLFFLTFQVNLDPI